MSTDGPRLVVRADAGPEIGIGHAMRSLAIAEAWREATGRATWLVATAPDSLVDRAGAAGIRVERLAGPAGSDLDAGTVRSLLDDPASAAVLDGSSFSATYLDRLDAVHDRVAIVDDTALLARYPVGLVINQNAHAGRSAYPPSGDPADGTPRYLLGTEYVLLRPEFRTARPQPRLPACASRLLISFGGADPRAMTSQAVAAIAALGRAAADLEVTAVVGPANPAGDAIARLRGQVPFRLTIATDVERMSDLMASTDLAVVSGGSSVWELARMGVPALVIETSPAEVDLCRGLANVGLFEPLGPSDKLGSSRLAAAIANRLGDLAWRTNMSTLGRRLVDGRGTERVVAAILDLTGSTSHPRVPWLGSVRTPRSNGFER